MADGSGRLGYSRSGDFLYGPETVSIMGAFCALLARDASPMPAAVQSRLIDEVLRARAGEKTGRDLYHDLFLGSALRVLPKDLRGRRPHAANLALAGLQVREGEDRGSWELRDPWGAAGGRIYTTAIAALILQAERRGQWLARFTAKG